MKIPPAFKITPDILEMLSRIDANRYFLSSLKITPVIRNKFIKLGVLKSSVFSARIEGNPLTINEYPRSNEEKNKQEIINIEKALHFIENEITSPKKLTKKFIKDLHRIVLSKVGAEPGCFREEAGAIFNQAGIAIYLSPPYWQIDKLLNKLISYINSPKEKFPLLTAFISHLVFEKIHPFLDGNGRVGRLLATSIIKSKNYNFGLPIPFEEYLDEHKDEYYYSLDRGLTKTEDYLVFMLKAFFEETEKIKKEIVEEEENPDKLNLPPRQEEIYKIIKEQKIMPFDSIFRRFLKVPKRTLRYDIKKLTDKGLIGKIGSTRGSFYKVK